MNVCCFEIEFDQLHETVSIIDQIRFLPVFLIARKVKYINRDGGQVIQEVSFEPFAIKFLIFLYFDSPWFTFKP
jgi:hypothetical protein